MIIRIVELHIQPESLADARKLLEEVAPKVRDMTGCNHLNILEDLHNAAHITTYSHWSSELDLDNYRHSEIFKTFWSAIKPMFSARAKAWSSHSRYYLP